MQQTILNWFQVEQATAIKNKHRFSIILMGNEVWALQQLNALLAEQSNQKGVWIGQQSIFKTDKCYFFKQSKQLLGQEITRLIYNAHQGFDLDTLGIVAGCIRAGGVFILLLPKLENWQDPAFQRFLSFASGIPKNHYFNYFKQLLKQKNINVIDQKSQNNLLLSAKIQKNIISCINPPFQTVEQQKAVEQIYKTATGRANRPFILTAPRGRGKTAALGLAIAQLLSNTTKTIIISAPQKSAIAVCLQYFNADATRLKFMPPDELTANHPKADVLMIDEAAAIPLALLKDWLKAYQRVIFSTTIQGYEGSGSGFNLRFKAFLQTNYKNYQAMHMQQPIRWAANDPLENFINKSLLVDSLPIDLSLVNEFEYLKINRHKLSQNPASLASFFALLRCAHYRTQPNNLRQFLDAPDISLYGIKQHQNWIGCAVCIDEGGLSADLISQIIKGRRRVQGHLVAQNLSYYHLQADLGKARYLRINRIAILPALQNQGLGQKLVRFIDQQRQQSFLACSFGANPALIRFWQKLGFQAVHLSHHLETSSMRHALIMLKGDKKRIMPLQQQMQQRLIKQLPFSFKVIYPQVVRLLLLKFNAKLSASALTETRLFAFDYRAYDLAIDGLQDFLIHQLKKSTLDWSIDQQNILIEQILQRHSAEKSFNGRKHQLKVLRGLFAKANTSDNI